MANEYEHKFLVHHIPASDLINPVRITQGYLSITETGTVRVRIKGDKGYLTVKGKASGIGRPEYEYEIPYEDAKAMLADQVPSDRIIEKVRYRYPYKGHTIEVDVFEGNNRDLIVAEVEVDRLDSPAPELPASWHVTPVGDLPINNDQLALNPFSEWIPRPI